MVGDFFQGANTLNAHVDARLETFLDDMNVAAAVKQIDSYINEVPASWTKALQTMMQTFSALRVLKRY